MSEIAGLTFEHQGPANGIVWFDSEETQNEEVWIAYLGDELREVCRRQWELGKQAKKLVPPARIELAAQGLGILCSIH